MVCEGVHSEVPIWVVEGVKLENPLRRTRSRPTWCNAIKTGLLVWGVLNGQGKLHASRNTGHLIRFEKTGRGPKDALYTQGKYPLYRTTRKIQHALI